MTAPKPPAGLNTKGRELWRGVVADFDLDVHERLLLMEACRVVDRLERLAAEVADGPLTITDRRGEEKAHPALSEARQQQIVLSRLLASLRLPSGETEAQPQRRGAARGAYQPRALSAVPSA